MEIFKTRTKFKMTDMLQPQTDEEYSDDPEKNIDSYAENTKEKYSKGLWMKDACKVINFSERPIKVIVINNASYLRKIRNKLVENESLSVLTTNSENS